MIRMMNGHAGRVNREGDLRRALRDGSEFVLHYQPIVSVPSGALAGLEVLVRWQHPVEGLLGPNEFIPLAEDTGLIVPLTYVILERACREVRAWLERLPRPSPSIQLHVNVPPQQLAVPGLVERVRDVVQRLPPSVRLSFEITERALVEDSSRVLETTKRLRALGVGFAVDDFGVGHSSLAYLQRLPVDSLKIDRSFIDGMVHVHASRVIVRAVLQLSRSLGVEAIAEGVERADQWHELADADCDFAQGFLIARPSPLADLVAHGMLHSAVPVAAVSNSCRS